MACAEQHPLDQFFSFLDKSNLDAFIVDHDDPHATEVPPASFERLAFISGFTGSAGLGLILRDKAYLWTDARYFIQAARELAFPWSLMRLGDPSCPKIDEFLKANPSLKRIGFDALTTQHKKLSFFKQELPDRDFIPFLSNPVDQIWGACRPPLRRDHIFIYPEKYTGESASSKLARIQDELKRKEIDSIIFTLLDEVAWVLNLRGSDCEESPLFYAYLLVERGCSTLFIEPHKLNPEVEAYLKGFGVETRGYDEVVCRLRELGEASKLWVSKTASVAVCEAFRGQLVVGDSPVCEWKALKNPTELRGMQDAHISDGIALAQFFAHVDRLKREELLFCETEFSLGELSTKYRSEQDDFFSLSFPPISSIGPNGAVIHYRPKECGSERIGPEMYLLDSGGQFFGGTTDVTRTVHFGVPTQEERECYTRVIKGHLALRHAIFPPNTTGQSLDSLAAQFLWKSGLNYHHGTGHGVGAFLNVHEGPMSISRLRKSPTGDLSVVYLEPGMCLSNEPGYYKEGSFGIRIENVMFVKKCETVEGFLEFEDLTLVPYCKELLDLTMLSDEEIEWINEYHRVIAGTLVPIMEAKSKIKYGEAIEYLEKAAVPIKRVE